MMETPTQKAKINTLEALCPGATFEFDPVLNMVHITSPTTHGNTMLLIVNLPFEGDDFDAWIDKEIASRQPFPLAQSPYRLICPICGPILITLENYNSQMASPYERWYCHECGTVCNFDDDYYEEHSPDDYEENQYDYDNPREDSDDWE